VGAEKSGENLLSLKAGMRSIRAGHASSIRCPTEAWPGKAATISSGDPVNTFRGGVARSSQGEDLNGSGNAQAVREQAGAAPRQRAISRDGPACDKEPTPRMEDQKEEQIEESAQKGIQWLKQIKPREKGSVRNGGEDLEGEQWAVRAGKTKDLQSKKHTRKVKTPHSLESIGNKTNRILFVPKTRHPY